MSDCISEAADDIEEIAYADCIERLRSVFSSRINTPLLDNRDRAALHFSACAGMQRAIEQYARDNNIQLKGI